MKITGRPAPHRKMSRCFEQTLKLLRAAPVDQKLWLFSHKPVWYDLLAPGAQPNAFQSALKKTVPANLQVSFAGHQHAFATYNFAPDADPQHPAGRPAQVVVGGGGTQLESLDPQSPFFRRAERSWQYRGGRGRMVVSMTACRRATEFCSIATAFCCWSAMPRAGRAA